MLAAALRRSAGDHPRSVLEYARARLFEPLGIDTEPAFVEPLADTTAADFAEAGFGWGTDPRGIPVGAFGLRLSAPDLVRLGELYLYTWNGHQVYAARGHEGQLIVVVPDQRSVTAIASANNPEFSMDEEALFPLLNETIIPGLDGG